MGYSTVQKGFSVYSEEGLVWGFFTGQMTWRRSHSQAGYTAQRKAAWRQH